VLPCVFCLWATTEVLRCGCGRFAFGHPSCVPCVALGCNLGEAVLQAKICSYPSSSSSFSLVLPCVDVFVAQSCGRALRCVGAPNLRTCGLADVPCIADVPCVCVADVRWGAQLADVPCVALGRPTCGRALCCVWAPILRTCLAFRWGAQPW
jgi:hypothetical protein